MLDINLTHEQQQKAVEQIQELMAQGISSGEAIQIVAKALREIHQKDEKETSDNKYVKILVSNHINLKLKNKGVKICLLLI